MIWRQVEINGRDVWFLYESVGETSEKVVMVDYDYMNPSSDLLRFENCSLTGERKGVFVTDGGRF